MIRPAPRHRFLLFSACVLTGAVGCRAGGDASLDADQPGEPIVEASSTPTDTQPDAVPQLPGITIHREAGYLDLQATVIGHGCEWLELVACTPGSREHEALVTIEARPSDLHLALLLLGVEAGTPQTGVRGDDGWRLVPPTGGVVDLHFVLPGEGDQPETVVPVEAWVFDRATDAVLPDTHDGGWIFTGSRLVTDPREPDLPPVYLADVNGTAVSLVHFGDETLGRDTTVTEANDGQNLQPHAPAMPPNGSPVLLRISRIDPELDETAE